MTTKLVSITNAGQAGIIQDVDPILLPPNAWTNGNNIRFYNNEVQKVLGQEEAQNPTLTDVQFLMPATKWDAGVPSKVWVYAGLDKVYYTDDGATDNNITRQDTDPADVDYTGSVLDRWQGCVNQNILILNNGADAPQMWLDQTSVLEDLRWDATHTWEDKGWRTKVMRSHKNFLFALQLNRNDSNGLNPNTVMWSEPAEPWAVPTTWDESDTSSICGSVELSSTEGQIVDGLSLKDNFIVYKESSIYNFAYIGGQYVWQVRDVSKNIGLFSQGAVCEFLGQHVFMSNDDILVTDGYQFKSVVNQKVRRKIFSEIDTTNCSRVFAVSNYAKEEVWFCYPTNGSSYVDKAAIWNYTSGAWSFKDLPDVNFINYGTLYSATVTENAWDDDTGTWDEDSSSWDEGTFSQSLFKMLGATDSSIKMFEVGYNNDGTSYESYVERTGLKLGDSNTMKRITAIYPKGVGEMNIYVGHAMHQNDNYTWEGPYNIIPEEDAQIRCRITGRYHAIRFVFEGDTEHKLHSYDIEYVDTGYGR